MMDMNSTHFDVPISKDEREACLGPVGSVAHVVRVIRMIQGRWKLPILFRLYADPSIRTLQLKRNLPGVTQKVLTEHLRELANDGLIQRVDFAEMPRRVEYQLSEMGRQLLPVLIATRSFSVSHPT
ncbi:MAG: winged helix-turn-helix transcriptional regulator [Janthinobacterium lividum]